MDYVFVRHDNDKESRGVLDGQAGVSDLKSAAADCLVTERVAAMAGGIYRRAWNGRVTCKGAAAYG